MNYSTIVFVGPHRDTLEEFKQTLLNLHPECNTSDPKVCVSKEVLQENLDFSQSYVKCFLVMPRGDRTLVYIENDDSSMYKELDHICKDEKGNWHPERAFIVFYRNKDVRGVYYEDSVELLWDSGCQKRLEEFSSVNQLISFKEKLNHLQKKAIYKFLTRKTSERSQSMEAPTRKTPVIVQPLPSTEETTEKTLLAPGNRSTNFALECCSLCCMCSKGCMRSIGCCIRKISCPPSYSVECTRRSNVLPHNES
ncbi:uncharacterized protein LOC134183321 isoform X3 [Corticium candelabrum]|uniref:uncharacterized protein LOC134183321 isoform X3 n=1 Tax=Corticium candelabrum TaxID=121492 RepID=UPI002E26C62D|nr:uncharacterized protein LOC134183321 isoform X3 [Corticium candelabrum]